MSFIFLIPLTIIALYESTLGTGRNAWVENWFRGDDEGAEDTPANRNPTVDDPSCSGMDISKVPFEELIKVFPNTTQVCLFLFIYGMAKKIVDMHSPLFFLQSSEATVLKEIEELKKKMDILLEKLNA